MCRNRDMQNPKLMKVGCHLSANVGKDSLKQGRTIYNRPQKTVTQNITQTLSKKLSLKVCLKLISCLVLLTSQNISLHFFKFTIRKSSLHTSTHYLSILLSSIYHILKMTMDCIVEVGFPP